LSAELCAQANFDSLESFLETLTDPWLLEELPSSLGTRAGGCAGLFAPECD